MKACIILNNMIIEDECDANGAKDFDYEQILESILNAHSTSFLVNSRTQWL